MKFIDHQKLSDESFPYPANLTLRESMYFYSRMKLIGLTGGIGSGKSTIAGLFRTLGIPAYDSDARAKDLMQSNDTVRGELIKLLGDEAFSDSGELNRKWIAGRVFNDPALLDQLNSIVHPAVYKDLLAWAAEEPQRNAPYLIQETAILFEENLGERMSSIMLVVAPEDIRIERVINRDRVPKEAVLDRMKHQWADEQKIPLADFIIYNDGERSLIDQVMDIDRMIRHNG